MFDQRRAEEVLDQLTVACTARDAGLRVAALAAADALSRDAFAAAGHLRGSQWLRAYTESSHDDARRILSLGRLLAHHPITRSAVESEQLSIPRAAVLAAAVTDARRRFYRAIEDVLVAQAIAVHRVDDVEVLVRHWCAMVDQELRPSEPRSNELHLALTLEGGSVVRGELDAPTTLALSEGLRGFDTGPDEVDGPAPPRSLAERQADALGDLARSALRVVKTDDDEGEPVPVVRTDRTTNIVVDALTLAGRTQEGVSGIVSSWDGRPMAVSAVEQFLCDTWVAAVLTDAGGAVIDASERTATFTDTQRRLIAVRDRHCIFPGCDAPASWCDVHHVHWRSRGGGRTLDNGALMCRRHHTLIHRDGWTIERAEGGGWVATCPRTRRTWTGRPGNPPPGREPPDRAEAEAAA